MADNGWNPWKLTTIGMALVLTTALVTGLVVANWSGTEPPQKAAAPAGARGLARPRPRASARRRPGPAA